MEFPLCMNFSYVEILLQWNFCYSGIPLHQNFHFVETFVISECCYVRILLCQNSIMLEFHNISRKPILKFHYITSIPLCYTNSITLKVHKLPEFCYNAGCNKIPYITGSLLHYQMLTELCYFTTILLCNGITLPGCDGILLCYLNSIIYLNFFTTCNEIPCCHNSVMGCNRILLQYTDFGIRHNKILLYYQNYMILP